MKIDSILESGSREEIVAFLTDYVPIVFSDKSENNIPKINSKGINELIVKGPSAYLEPVCVSACENLWKKNIYVLASINVSNDLYLILDKLDVQNMEIFKNKYREHPENYCLNLGQSKYTAIKVSNYLEEKNLERLLKKLVKDFKLQDIQRGYLTEKTFLMNVCNCEKVEGLTEYKKQDLQVVFDIKKMDKSFKEYLQDSEYKDFYIPNEHRIYLNNYYYEAHQNYINNKAKKDV